MKDKFGLEGAARHLAWYWVGFRSEQKQTWPGALDQTAAGTLRAGLICVLVYVGVSALARSRNLA